MTDNERFLRAYVTRHAETQGDDHPLVVAVRGVLAELDRVRAGARMATCYRCGECGTSSFTITSASDQFNIACGNGHRWVSTPGWVVTVHQNDESGPSQTEV